MCGIIGRYNLHRDQNKHAERDMRLTHNALEKIIRRGPDDKSVQILDGGRIILGHVRLSIVDLSSAGNQPFISKCGRFTIVFNGEIYNHEAMRKRLVNNGFYDFKSWSDTETFLEYIVKFGLKVALTDYEGMFAFALYDNVSKEVILGRDRFGEKPLFYGIFNNVLYFSSVTSTFTTFGLDLTVDESALGSVLENGYISDNITIYSEIKRLSPGCILQCSEAGIEINEYWSHRGRISALDRSTGSHTSKVRHALDLSVENILRTDVEVGTFLSGGIDSSLVTCIAREHKSDLHTFSIGFHQQEYNEAPYAAAIADYIGTRHHEIIIKEDQVLSLVNQAVAAFDEPFADSSQLPTLLVSELAKKYVTVSVSGDGGDELFAGYNRYTIALKVFNLLRQLPPLAKSIAIKLLNERSILYRPLIIFAKHLTSFNNPRDKINKLSKILETSNREDLYEQLLRAADYSWLKKEPSNKNIINSNGIVLDEFSDLEFMQINDLESYLVDDILVKVDRASMYHSLEIRTPFLNSEIFDLAFNIHDKDKTNGRKGKLVLREILGEYLPLDLYERPKMGFGIPIEKWMLGPLREDIDGIFNSEKFLDQTAFMADKVRKDWFSQKNKNYYGFWNAYMIGKWLENNI